MKFKCPACKKILNRDMRYKWNNLTKRGIKSFCVDTMRDVFLKPVKPTTSEGEK